MVWGMSAPCRRSVVDGGDLSPFSGGVGGCGLVGGVGEVAVVVVDDLLDVGWVPSVD